MSTGRAKDREIPGDRVVHETLETLRSDLGTAELEVVSTESETSDSPAATPLSVDDGTVKLDKISKSGRYMTDATTTLTKSPMPAVARQLNYHLPQVFQGALERTRAAVGPSIRIVGRRGRDGIGVARQPGTAMGTGRSGDREIYRTPPDLEPRPALTPGVGDSEARDHDRAGARHMTGLSGGPSSRIGVIGAGDISSTYLRAGKLFPELAFQAVADLERDRADARAREFGIESVSVELLLANPDIDLILNLTTPAAHFEVSLAALEAGKGVYSEKPLAISMRDGKCLLERARSLGLPLGCAPDTFLGAGLQTCRSAIDKGLIGRPLAATAFFMSSGPESWHPNPYFFFQPGAGPLFDMGPYYLTALVHLVGGVRRVGAFAGAGRVERVAASGEVIPVNTPTHITTSLEHEGGAISTLVTSFDVQTSDLPRIEIYGTEGTLDVPDPNGFGGPARIRRGRDDEWEDLELINPYTEQSRGLGLAELIRAQSVGAPPRASSDLALHVLELMELALASAESATALVPSTRPERPRPLAAGPLEESFG
ncbi:MAG: Gfo/Idh/MocA family oxidoreductase [Truepera sp.]|nr:Gfo/Idh/MocA family oxidoreductase [Truepera sp.]